MSLRLPPLQTLRAFEAAARLGSVSRAADELSVTHGAVSHQIRHLEAYLGLPLFRRAGRGIAVNEDGRIYAQQVRRGLDELARATGLVLAQPRADELVVSVVPSFGSRWLMPRLKGFVDAHPDLDLQIRASLDTVDFDQEAVDCAIRMGAGNWPSVSTRFLMGDAYFPVCSPAFNGGRIPLRPVELDDCVLLRSAAEPWGPWFEAAGLRRPEPRHGPGYNDANLLLQAAAAGQGVALARATLVDEDLAAGRLVRLFDVAAPSRQFLYLVWPPRSDRAAKLELLRTWLLGQVAAYTPVSAVALSAPPV